MIERQVGSASEDQAGREVTIVPVGDSSVKVECSPLVTFPSPYSVPEALTNWTKVASYVVDSNAAAGFSFQPWYYFLDIPYVRKALAGRELLKGCLEIKAVTRVTPFHYGHLAVAWAPNSFVRQSVPAAYPLGDFNYWSSRKQVVRMDLGSPSEAVIQCPMVDPQGGVANITSTQTGLVNDQYWYHFMMNGDIEVAFVNNAVYRVDGGAIDFPMDFYVRLTPDTQLTGLALTPLVEALSNEGPLSGALTGVGDILKVGAKIVPSYDSVLSPMAAAAHLGAKMARAVGLGTPLHPISRVLSTRLRSYAGFQSDVVNDSQVMATSAVTQRGLAPGAAGVLEDEMALSHMTSRYGVMDVIQMTAAQTEGTQLDLHGVSPTFCVPTATTAYCPPSVGYVASAFRYWTGSLKYRLTVVSSKYHSGRVRVVYDPSPWFNSALVPSSSEAGFVYNELFDIANGTVLEFEVPWTQARPWATTARRPESTLPSGDTVSSHRDRFNGVLRFLVDSPLTSSNLTATPPVYIIVEVAGGGDFKLARPEAQQILFEPLSAAVASVEAKAPLRIFGGGVKFQNPELLCMGESISSVRDVIKMMQPLGKIRAKSAAVVDATFKLACTRVTCFPVFPRTRDGKRVSTAADGGFLDDVGVTTDYISYFRPAFRACSGGLRVRITSPGGTSILSGDLPGLCSADYTPVWAAVAYGSFDTEFTYAQLWDTTDVTTAANVWPQVSDLQASFPCVVKNIAQESLEFTVPHISDVLTYDGSRRMNEKIDGDQYFGLFRGVKLLVWGLYGNTTTEFAGRTNGPFISVAAADDVQYSYFDGPPMGKQV